MMKVLGLIAACTIIGCLCATGCSGGEESNADAIKNMKKTENQNPPLPEEGFVDGRTQMMKDLQNKKGGPMNKGR